MQDEQTKELAVAEKFSASDLLNDVANRHMVDAKSMWNLIKSQVLKGKDGREPTTLECQYFLTVCREYGLNPMVKQIYGFQTKSGQIEPVISIDGWLHLIRNHGNFKGLAVGVEWKDGVNNGRRVPLYGWVEFWTTDGTFTRQEPFRWEEDFIECRRDTGPWKSHPSRMIRHKALIQGARYLFGFSGIYDHDEGEAIVQAEDARVEEVATVDMSKATVTPEPPVKTSINPVPGVSVDAEADQVTALACKRVNDAAAALMPGWNDDGVKAQLTALWHHQKDWFEARPCSLDRFLAQGLSYFTDRQLDELSCILIACKVRADAIDYDGSEKASAELKVVADEPKAEPEPAKKTTRRTSKKADVRRTAMILEVRTAASALSFEPITVFGTTINTDAEGLVGYWTDNADIDKMSDSELEGLAQRVRSAVHRVDGGAAFHPNVVKGLQEKAEARENASSQNPAPDERLHPQMTEDDRRSFWTTIHGVALKIGQKRAYAKVPMSASAATPERVKLDEAQRQKYMGEQTNTIFAVWTGAEPLDGNMAKVEDATIRSAYAASRDAHIAEFGVPVGA